MTFPGHCKGAATFSVSVRGSQVAPSVILLYCGNQAVVSLYSLAELGVSEYWQAHLWLARTHSTEVRMIEANNAPSVCAANQLASGTNSSREEVEPAVGDVPATMKTLETPTPMN